MLEDLILDVLNITTIDCFIHRARVNRLMIWNLVALEHFYQSITIEYERKYICYLVIFTLVAIEMVSSARRELSIDLSSSSVCA